MTSFTLEEDLFLCELLNKNIESWKDVDDKDIIHNLNLAQSIVDKISKKPRIKKSKNFDKENIPYDAIKDLFNKILWDNFPTCQFIKPGSMRAKHVKARWEYELPDLKSWEKFFEQVKRSDFLCGKVLIKQTGKPFRCSFDWLINETNCAKVIDDNYANEG